MFQAISQQDYKALASYPALIYGLGTSPTGPMAVAWWPDRDGDKICYLALHHDVHTITEQLQHRFPRNALLRDDRRAQDFAAAYDAKAKPPAILMKGTPFFLKIWETLYNSKAGETMSYGALAALAGRPKASRAVGRAMATNPIALIMPCHRVLRSAGGLGGYAYGLEIKERLLANERPGSA